MLDLPFINEQPFSAVKHGLNFRSSPFFSTCLEATLASSLATAGKKRPVERRSAAQFEALGCSPRWGAAFRKARSVASRSLARDVLNICCPKKSPGDANAIYVQTKWLDFGIHQVSVNDLDDQELSQSASDVFTQHAQLKAKAL